MGTALFELEQVLRSSNFTLTREEEDIIKKCKAKSLKDFTLTALVSSSVVWAATRRLGYGYRINLSGGAGFFSGMWRFDRSLDSCVETILSLEGSRMQNELAKILLTKHHDDPQTMKVMKKHFYSESVFDDNSSDRPIARWRYRNAFFDSGAQSQRIDDGDNNNANAKSEPKDPKQFAEPKQFSMNPAVEVTVDPFDCVFGYPEKGQEIPHPDTTDIAPKRRVRSERRSHRRRRSHHTEVSSDKSSLHSQTVGLTSDEKEP